MSPNPLFLNKSFNNMYLTLLKVYDSCKITTVINDKHLIIIHMITY